MPSAHSCLCPRTQTPAPPAWLQQPSAGGNSDPAGAARRSQRRVPQAGFKRQQQSPWPPTPRKSPGTKNNSSERPSGGAVGIRAPPTAHRAFPQPLAHPVPRRGKERQQKVPLTGPVHGSLRQRRVGLRGGAVVAAGLSAAKAGALLPSESPHARAGPANPIPPRRPPSRPPLFSSPQEPGHPFPPSSAVAQRGDAGLPWRAGPCPSGRGARAVPTPRLELVPPQSRYRHRPVPGRYRTPVSVTGPLQRRLLAPPNGQGATV